MVEVVQFGENQKRSILSQVLPDFIRKSLTYKAVTQSEPLQADAGEHRASRLQFSFYAVGAVPYTVYTNYNDLVAVPYI